MQYPNLQKLAQHILVTGYSGSGKSTLAAQLASELGLPIHKLDDDPNVRAYFKNPNNFVFSKEDPEAVTALNNMVQNVKALSEPHIVEGTQVAYVPEYWPGNRLIYVDTPPTQVVRQRLARDRAKGKDVSPGSAKARQRALIAKLLIKEMEQPFNDVQAYPEVERMRPNREFAKKLMEELRKERASRVA